LVGSASLRRFLQLRVLAIRRFFFKRGDRLLMPLKPDLLNIGLVE